MKWSSSQYFSFPISSTHQQSTANALLPRGRGGRCPSQPCTYVPIICIQHPQHTRKTQTYMTIHPPSATNKDNQGGNVQIQEAGRQGHCLVACRHAPPSFVVGQATRSMHCIPRPSAHNRWEGFLPSYLSSSLENAEIQRRIEPRKR